jgi:hypothetical protein
MEFEELKCPKCKEFFDTSNGKIPRLLINCGHSLCEICIVNKLNEKDLEGFSVIKCPEDEEVYSQITNVDQFPKNITLIKLLNKSVETKKSIMMQIESLPTMNCNSEESTSSIKVTQTSETINLTIISTPPNKNVIKAADNNTEDTSSSITNTIPRKCVMENSEIINNINNTILTNQSVPSSETKNDASVLNPGLTACNNRSSLRIGLLLKQDSRLNFQHDKTNRHVTNNYSEFSPNDPTIFCQVHANRALELVCLDDKEKICTNCALFGNHKKHNIISEEDFIKEIEVKAEILIELFELIDNGSASFTDASFSNKFSNLLEKSKQKSEALSKQVKDFIQELISNIKKSEQDILSRIKNKFESINNQIKETLEIPKEIITKAEEWKSGVQLKLDKLNEISDSTITNGFTNEEIAKLIEINVTNQETIAYAEEITNELEKIKSISTDQIENMIYNLGVEFNYETALKLNNLVHVQQFEEGNKLEESPKKKRKNSVEVLSNQSNHHRSTNIVQNIPNNNNISIQSIATTTSETMATYFAATENETIQGNCNSGNHSFLNMSEDSAIIRMNNLIANKNGEMNKVKEIPVPKARNSNAGVVNTSINNIAIKSNQNKGKIISYSTNSNNNLNVVVNNPGANNILTVNPSINNIKLTAGSRVEKVERSRISPNRKDECSKSPTPDRDKIVFIKSQFKNEIANFTGYGKFIYN